MMESESHEYPWPPSRIGVEEVRLLALDQQTAYNLTERSSCHHNQSDDESRVYFLASVLGVLSGKGREEAIVEGARANTRLCRVAALELNFAARSDHDNHSLEHGEQHEPLNFVKSPSGPITAVHIKEELTGPTTTWSIALHHPY
jgi:hypothetical protein